MMHAASEGVQHQGLRCLRTKNKNDTSTHHVPTIQYKWDWIRYYIVLGKSSRVDPGGKVLQDSRVSM